MMKFTVILLYPPMPLADPVETYTAKVEIPTATKPTPLSPERRAITAAQREAFYKLPPSERRGRRMKDFQPVVVLMWHGPVYNPQLNTYL